jgi:hypothetical protein
MAPADLIELSAVSRALDEYDQVGRDLFLANLASAEPAATCRGDLRRNCLD